MSNDSGPSKKLVIAGVVIFIVVIALVLFLVFDAVSPNREEPEDQFSNFPVSPPNDVFTEPTVQVVSDPMPIGIPRQQNSQDEIRDIFVSVETIEPQVDQAELDALAYLNRQPRPSTSGGGVVTSAGPAATQERKRLTPEDINAALEANPNSIFLDDQMAEYFSGWRPPQDIAESFAQLTQQSWALEDRMDMSTIIDTRNSQQIIDVTDQTISSCGDIKIVADADMSAPQLAVELSRDNAALCLGESITSMCQPTSVTNAGISYLAADFGTGCSVGTMFGGFANLCKITPDPTKLGKLDSKEIGRLIADFFVAPTTAECKVYRY